MLTVSVPRIFKTAGRASVMELLVGKVMAKFLHFRNLSKTLLRVMFRKSSSSGNFESFPLINGVAGLVCRSQHCSKRTLNKISQNCFENFGKFQRRTEMSTFLVN